MVALLVGLKLRLLRGSLRCSAWRRAGLVLGSLYALAVTVLAGIGLVGLRLAGPHVAGDVTTVAFTSVTIGWLLFSLLLFGVDQTVDPARFALLPLRAERLAPGLLAAGLVGIPGIATTLVALSLLGTWSIGVAPLVAAAVSIALGVPLCVLWTRAATALLSQGLASRRARDVTMVIFTVLVIAPSFVGGLAGGSLGQQDLGGMRTLLHRAADVAGWSPFGWVWSLPGLVAAGRWWSAAAHLALALALTAALWKLWVSTLRRALTSSGSSDASSRRHRTRASTWPFPPTPGGAVAWRCLLYWRRDPRYVTSLLAMLLLPAMLVVSQLFSGETSRTFIAFAPLVLALLGPAGMVSDIAYDGSAVSLHVITGISGRADRAGRVMAASAVMVPLLVVALVACTLLSHGLGLLPVTVGLSIGLMGAGFGAAMWVGSFLPGQAPAPGSNPFGGAGSGGLKVLTAFALTAAIALAASTPVIVIAALSAVFWWMGWLTIPAGVLLGFVVLRGGIVLGGRRLDNTWPELLAEVSQPT